MARSEASGRWILWQTFKLHLFIEAADLLFGPKYALVILFLSFVSSLYIQFYPTSSFLTTKSSSLPKITSLSDLTFRPAEQNLWQHLSTITAPLQKPKHYLVRFKNYYRSWLLTTWLRLRQNTVIGKGNQWRNSQCSTMIESRGLFPNPSSLSDDVFCC